MIAFTEHTLSNGLRVIIHVDKSTPLAAMNLLYDIGARDEDPDKTGFAHLFEHLMFEGSSNIPHYDTPLQLAGGDNNAFTSNDITNYYLTLPAVNIETGFWLESDRMLQLAFSQEKLDIQKKVVCEEFKQRYLNQPYGDIWLLIRPLIYETHPYHWATIGKDLSHIEHATLEQVKSFFYQYYAPNNSVLVISGNVDVEQIIALSEKWFGPIPKREVPQRHLPKEPMQTKQKRLRVERNVPADLLLMAFHMPERSHPDYYAYDLLSDILSNGKSSLLYQRLVKEQKKFSDIGAYVMGSIDPGLIIISGRLNRSVSLQDGEAAVWDVLNEIKETGMADATLQKVKNRYETAEQLSLMTVLNKAMKLAFAAHLGDVNLVNAESKLYRAVTTDAIQRVAKEAFRIENSTVLEYKAKPITA